MLSMDIHLALMTLNSGYPSKESWQAMTRTLLLVSHAADMAKGLKREDIGAMNSAIIWLENTFDQATGQWLVSEAARAIIHKGVLATERLLHQLSRDELMSGFRLMRQE